MWLEVGLDDVSLNACGSAVATCGCHATHSCDDAKVGTLSSGGGLALRGGFGHMPTQCTMPPPTDSEACSVTSVSAAPLLWAVTALRIAPNQLRSLHDLHRTYRVAPSSFVCMLILCAGCLCSVLSASACRSRFRGGAFRLCHLCVDRSLGARSFHNGSLECRVSRRRQCCSVLG